MGKAMSYTSGPWESDRNLLEPYVMARGMYVARAHGGKDRQANARLIAAAPEMFELLKQMRYSICGPSAPQSPAIDAIIAKVEGDEQEEKHDGPR